ncbi:pyroglutamyl-peptidase I [Tenuibacillus multivorans]|uniref:Pyroglutamyl-peptidase I n=1 Tax=Tenuibacillus multivorans TaxID=237069 RepID=A0A1H0EK42_9BACI|nr:pyroglutamyl-peptidase I [Tenuibacillus multivorans]GEL77128.1 pyrrolidone-carboxylate peptidase [Tenuibacillus multivorans]SDN82639.1 pyroglutamyl-peptidase [Tenuibacillus multivorans]
MKKILLTGFEPFLSFKTNPTMEIAHNLNKNTVNDYEIVSRILTVDFSKSGKQMIEAIDEVEPDVVVALGLAGDRKHMTPERIAINCNDGPEDNEGHKPNGEKIIEDGPDGYFSTLPIKDIVENIKSHGLPASISNTAGTYLCNNVMYHALHHSETNGYNYRAGFIHMPPSHDIALKQPQLSSWSQDDLEQAVWLALEKL